MKAAFAAGQDIHATTASQIFHTPIDQVTPTQRRQAKAINFGIVYGMSGFGLARQLDISPKEGQRYIDSYLAKYPEILAYMERTKRFVHENGYVLTPFKRKCFIEGANSAAPGQRSAAERAAINAPIQGGNADIMKLAMLKINAAVSQHKLPADLLLQVHDELIFEVAADQAESSAKLIKDLMETSVTISLPLVVDVKIGRNWGEVH
jgi:DNA polymerase-1